MDAPGRGRDGASLAPVVVVGQLARDLVLVVDEVPAAGQSAVVRERREMLGGKGANQAVVLAQLGIPVALVPLTDTPVADTTGAGDAFTAAMIASLARGCPPQRAGRTAVAAAGATVGHPGGRPELTRPALRHQVSLLQQARAGRDR